MLYKRQVIKELSWHSIGIFFLLLGTLSAIQLVNILGKVAKGVMQVDLLMTAMSVAVVGLMPLVLGITCFMSVLAVFTSYWRYSEMTVWLASGLALRKWLTPIFWFAVPFFLLSLFLSLVLIPKINQQGLEYSNFVQQQPTLNFIDQGVFTPISGGVVFIDSYDPKNGAIETFFSHEVNPDSGKFTVTLAKKGQIRLANNELKMTLSEATRYLGYPNRADFSVFKTPAIEYVLRVHGPEAEMGETEDNVNTLPTSQLYKSASPRGKSALFWRVTLPISILILSLWALSLSYINPRSNKNFNIIYAILVFFVYQNLQIITKNLIYKGVVGFWPGLIATHMLMLFLALVFLYYRFTSRTNLFARLKQRLAH